MLPSNGHNEYEMAGIVEDNQDNTMENVAEEYLKKHKILSLFENITARLVFEQPEDPNELMRNHIRSLMESRAFELDYPCPFDSSNIKCLFGMLDSACCGHIRPEQFKSALEIFGASKILEDTPQYMNNENISFDIFLTQMRDGISNASATFGAPDY